MRLMQHWTHLQELRSLMGKGKASQSNTEENIRLLLLIHTDQRLYMIGRKDVSTTRSIIQNIAMETGDRTQFWLR